MKISTKARYGLKVMLELAFGGKELYPVSDLATVSGTTVAYLEQVMPLLKKAGLVKSTRGAFGGYSLMKPASEITVGSILRALEDELEFVDCIKSDCSNKCTCQSYYVWERIYKAINESVEHILLSDLDRTKENEI